MNFVARDAFYAFVKIQDVFSYGNPTCVACACFVFVLFVRCQGYGGRAARPVGARGHPWLHQHHVSGGIDGAAHAHGALGADLVSVDVLVFCSHWRGVSSFSGRGLRKRSGAQELRV